MPINYNAGTIQPYKDSGLSFWFSTNVDPNFKANCPITITKGSFTPPTDGSALSEIEITISGSNV